MHVIVFCFSGRNLGALFEVLRVGLNIIDLNLLWCYFSTNSRIDRTKRIALYYFYYGLLNRSIRKDNFEVVSYPTIISSFVLRF